MIALAALFGAAAWTEQSSLSAPVTPAEPITVTPERILIAPGPVLRASSLVGAPPLPTEGAVVRMTCLTNWAGSLERCHASDEPSVWAEFALKRMRGYRIDVTGMSLGPASNQPVSISVRLLPSEQRELVLSGEIDSGPSQLIFEEQPQEPRHDGFYPSFAIRAGIETNVSLACRVLDDHSLFCPEGQVVPGLAAETAEQRAGREGLFLFAAQQRMGQLRAAPMLRDGRPSAGYQFRMTVAFRLPELDQ